MRSSYPVGQTDLVSYTQIVRVHIFSNAIYILVTLNATAQDLCMDTLGVCHLLGSTCMMQVVPLPQETLLFSNNPHLHLSNADIFTLVCHFCTGV